MKTISCGDIRIEHIGQKCTLAGWVHRRRDHGGLIFIDLRDREGIIQVVFDPESNPNTHKIAEKFRNEWVVQIEGAVRPRPEGSENPDLATGQTEILATKARVLNESKTPPFYINEDSETDELVRMEYRYLDLRRPVMRDMLIFRHKVVKFIRDFLNDRGFLEVETPILIKSTPEGARDYVVPSRLHPGRFYALPQSPQQLKQLLMAGGVEKYFQIARCFRDEDPRADRQAEHTQLDLEMSFVEQNDILDLIEELYTELARSLVPEKRLVSPFPRLTYRESMDRFASDKPDLRFGLEMATLNDIVNNSGFKVFQTVVENGGIVKGFAVPDCANYPRRKLDDLVEFVQTRGAKGLVYIGLTGEGSIEDLKDNQVKSPVSKYLSLKTIKSISKATGANVGDLILIVAGADKSTNVALSALRNEMAKQLKLIDSEVLHFAFIVDFPLFEWNDEDGKWDAMHHAFTMPKPGYAQFLNSDPGKVIGQLYDLVCNGLECASGSIRIHERHLQERVLNLLGYDNTQITERFGQLLRSFEYGAPPHGGIAPGIERLLMVLTNTDNIRDVVAFPKTQTGVDPLFDSPSPIELEQLGELHIKLVEQV